MMMSKTLFLLMAEFNAPAVPLEKCYHYLGYRCLKTAENAARDFTLPVPCIRGRDSQKSPRLIMLEDLANYLDARAAEGRELFNKIQGAA
jgi:hypothetical protein